MTTHHTPSPLPLSGIRVLDLSRILAGPWAAQTLADLGAEVIKVERPSTGDDTRVWGPPFLKDANTGERADAAYFMTCNRGKQSITVDFTQASGAELLKTLVKKCDILIENFKVGGLKKYGLDYASLKEIHPGLIYCSITGFGQTGPYAERPGYDFLIQAMGGLMSITGERDDKAGGGPQKVGVAITDVMTGLYSTVGILSALRARDLTGEGQHLDMALMDVQVAALANQASSYLVTGESPVRLGNEHPSITPYQSLPAKDGYFILATGNDSQFKNFCQAAGRPELSGDARFLTNKDRVMHRDQLTPLLEEITRTRNIDEWVLIMERAGVPCGPINTLERVFADPQVQARELRVDIPHAQYGSVPSVASPIRLSKTPIQYNKAPPQLGEHNEAVLQGLLGLSDQEMTRLQEAGIL
jgi:crotonobetainyl-CoA:carnitine CoA-transferase CaiB-like acyl-CoA transferase